MIIFGYNVTGGCYWFKLIQSAFEANKLVKN